MKEWIKDIGIAVIIGILLLQVIKPTIVKEHSMEPTLHSNDYIFLSKQAYRFGTPEYGDIIVFHTDLTREDGKEKLLIKRIVALGGDTVSITGGVVYLDGYTATEMEEITVPEGHAFVMGDNRQNSIDSRDPRVGFLDLDEVVGKAVFRLYPFRDIGLL